jgi:hypothetical protein
LLHCFGAPAYLALDTPLVNTNDETNPFRKRSRDRLDGCFRYGISSIRSRGRFEYRRNQVG